MGGGSSLEALLRSARRITGTLAVGLALASCTGTPSSSSSSNGWNDKDPYTQPADTTDAGVYVAEGDLYRLAGVQENLGCENVSFEVYSNTGTPLARVEDLTDDTCLPISPPGAVNLVGFGRLFRVTDAAQAIEQMVYFSCWPAGREAQMIIKDGRAQFETLECFVDEIYSEHSRNAIAIRGHIHGAAFDAGASNSWTVRAQDMDFRDVTPTLRYESIAGEVFACEPDETAR